MSQVYEKVKELVMSRLGVQEDEVRMDASFKDDLGTDSLEIVEMVMEFEDEFQIEVPDEAAESLLTVGDVVRYIEGNQ